jgi:integrase
MSKKSVQENVQARFPKTDARYWKDRLFRNSYTKGNERGETVTWCVKIGHLKHRETFNMQTSNAAAASSKAAGIYRRILAEGWAPVLAELKPRSPKKKVVTVGDFIELIAKHPGDARPATFTQYLRCLRRLAADIAGVDRDGVGKFDHYNGLSDAWRAKVDSVKMSVLTPGSIRLWMSACLAGDLDPVELQRRKITVNAVVVKVKALWSPRRLKLIPDDEVREEVAGLNPTVGVDLFDEPDLSYRAKFDPATLLADAQTELATRSTLWMAFALLLFGGLRRRELDTLLWSSVDTKRGIINVEPNPHFQPKSATSIRQINVPPELQTLLHQWRASDPKARFVIPSTKLAPKATEREYRCQRVFDELIVWLRSKGVEGNKPIHTLRKAAGNLVNEHFGLLAASRFLGHSDTRITGRFYADGRGATVGLGGVLALKGRAVQDEAAADAHRPVLTPT